MMVFLSLWCSGLWLARGFDQRLGVSSSDHWWFCGDARVAPEWGGRLLCCRSSCLSCRRLSIRAIISKVRFLFEDFGSESREGSEGLTAEFFVG